MTRRRVAGSLRSRLFWAIALVVLLCVGVSLAAGLVLTRRAVERANLDDLAHQAALLAGREKVSILPGAHIAELTPYLAKQHERPVVSPLKEPPAYLPAHALASLVAGRAARGTVHTDGRDYLFAAEPLPPHKLLMLLRVKSLAASDWTPFLEGLLLAALIGAVLAALVALVLARVIARPVRRVAEATRSLARGTEPAPVPLEGADELVVLASSFNDLATQLARAREAERAFLLSVSHELKTPLTAIRGWAEALREGAVSVDDATETVAIEAARLERLVGDLLDLARMNKSEFSVRREEIDLVEVAADTVRRYEQRARAFGVTVEALVDGDAPALGDHDRMLQVVSNLVENALRLTPRGGGVRVVVGPGRVAVEDDGPGLKDEELPRAFDRFFLYSRYGRDRPVGTGLGLAIVKELTEAMGGRVSVRSVEGGPTVFSVTLAVPRTAPVRAATTRA
jgi:two-component system sensor histidine kinase BaeS